MVGEGNLKTENERLEGGEVGLLKACGISFVKLNTIKDSCPTRLVRKGNISTSVYLV